MTLKLFHVDAFSSKPFGGNQAAVCMLTEPRSYIWMQRLAEEMNLSETAFLLKEAKGYNLRWFTPTVEIELCGHATFGQRAHSLGTGLSFSERRSTLFDDERLASRTSGGQLD